MSGRDSLTGHRLFGDLTAPGRASFDWAVLCATVALAVPVAGLLGVGFALRSRQKGYARWKAAFAMSLWCLFLGVIIRGMFHLGVIP